MDSGQVSLTSALVVAVKKALSGAFQEALERFEPEFALLLYKEEGSQEPEIQVSYGFDETPVQDSGHVSFGLIRSCLSKGETVKIVNVHEDSEHANRNSVVVSGIRSVLCVPILRPDGSVVGGFYFDNRLQNPNFHDEGIVALETLADETGRTVADIKMSFDSPAARTEPEKDEMERWLALRKSGLEAYQAGDYARAASLFEQSLALAERWGPRQELAVSLNELGQALRGRGEVAESIELFERGLNILEQVGEDRGPLAVPLMSNLAGAYHQHSNPSQAEALYRYCLDIVTERGQTDAILPVLENLSVIAEEMEKPNDACRWLEQAIETATSLNGPDHKAIAKYRARLEALKS